MSNKPSILIIYTGGTIGMISNPETGSFKAFDFKNLTDIVPALKQFGYKLTTHSFKNPIDSSDISPKIWIKLAKILVENYHKYDGFVILHGTDTMAFTASALSFMLSNFNKPIILTGSQLPIETLRTDGKENMITSIEIAAARSNGRPVIPEVCIYFENKLYRGNRTIKRNAEHFDAFESANYPFLAEVGIHIKYNYQAIQKPEPDKPVFSKIKLNNNVAILKIFPGMNKKYVSNFFSTKDLEAVVLETYGSGNATTKKWFIDILKKAIKKGIIILNVSQCIAGSVIPGRYETSVELKKIGIIGGNDITTEAAVTKLMYLLALKLSRKELKYYLRMPIAGEMTVNEQS